jgi:MtrB/PioB family decaheme-associated outer membrane protein
MKTAEGKFAVSAVALAVQGAFIAMCAMPVVGHAEQAMNDDLRAEVFPTNYVEVGAIGVSKDSQKFGEYNGLYEKGGYLLGNLDVRGGDSYGEGDGTMRWRVYGSNLGTDSRELGATVGNQGRWSVGVGFDQLRHYTTDGSYQTPYSGSMGGNSFTLPSSFGVINTTTTTTNGIITSASKGAQTLTDTQLASFHTEDVYSQREKSSFTAGYHFDAHWDVKFDFSRLDQTGAKLISSGTDAFTGGPGGFNYGGERVAMLMNPTKFKTDTYTLALNWVGTKAHVSASYYGSKFHDDYTGLSFSNPWVSGGTGASPVPPTGTDPGAPFPVDTMSTPPSNDFHQFSLNGGYNFSRATRLAGGISYARNTQNETYDGTYTTTPNTISVLPVSSLNGKVITTHADMKLTHQATKDLGLSAGVKYNERDNRTPSNIYTFLDLGGTAQTAYNVPMSNRRTQTELGGDYRITSTQRLNVAYEYDKIQRWCRTSVPSSVLIDPSGTTIAAYYGVGGTDCAQVPESKENRLALGYKVRATDSVDVTAGYTYGRRKSEVNGAFYNPMQANSEGFEDYGYLAFFDASRKEHLLKAGVNWQATDKLSVGLNGRYMKDEYDSDLGVQNGHTSSVNVDTSYSFTELSMVSVYATWQRRDRDLLTANGRNAVAPLPNHWTNTLTDEDDTLGISGKQKGLLSSKFDLGEDFTYSLAKTHYTTNVQYTLTGNAAIGALSYGDTPDVRSELTQFRLSGTYHVDKMSSVVVGYLYQRLKAQDYYYNAYQYGYTPTSLMPTNQLAPHYNVQVIAVGYQYKWR